MLARDEPVNWEPYGATKIRWNMIFATYDELSVGRMKVKFSDGLRISCDECQRLSDEASYLRDVRNSRAVLGLGIESFHR